MISIDPATIGERDVYKLLVGSVIPRPVALVTTLSDNGALNAAPYSYFNIVTADPPLLSVAIQRKQGMQKDTSRNAIAKGEFVIHIADASYLEQLNQTAANLPAHESEVAMAGLTPVASETISVPGIAEARIRMECVLEHALPLGGTVDAPSTDLLIGRVVRFHFHEAVFEENYHIHAAALDPISRLAGHDYAKLGELITIERPQ